MKKTFKTAVVVALVTAAVVAYSARRPVRAIRPPQAACAFQFITTNSTTPPQPIDGLQLTIDNADAETLAIVHVSADTGVDATAEVRLSYSIDGGPPQEDVFGPANLANHQEFFEGRHLMAVIPLGPGVHTINPVWRVSGAPGLNAIMDSRCATVEGFTQ
jgi:hypothetical protein